MVERSPEEAGVVSSILTPGTRELYMASTVLSATCLQQEPEEAGPSTELRINSISSMELVPSLPREPQTPGPDSSMVEQLPLKQRVVGSSPTRVTKTAPHGAVLLSPK